MTEQASPRTAGFVGLITANSCMKRELGKKLIEDFLPGKALTHVIATSGAYIPGHGTPTVILFARIERPAGRDIRAVLGIRGEPSTPDDAARGKVQRPVPQTGRWSVPGWAPTLERGSQKRDGSLPRPS